MKKILLLLSLLIISASTLKSQELQIIQGQTYLMDKCGFMEEEDEANNFTSVENWGYSYDSLLVDLNLWGQSPYVKIDSIGLSVQGRPLWQLTISSNPNDITNKRTVFIHARTHPQETEGFWVTEQIINILLSENELGQIIRENCVFYIVPMYNPDGVELGYPRRNANNVDLESNWFTFPNEPEVSALKARFTELMSSANPIEVELNMHSSSLCKRYFVYHDSAGTSPQFALMQQNFIEGIRSYYPTGIEPWNYYISWTSGNPMKYPESWFWYYHGESVMALTYEDMYQCSGTGNFNITANAILRGVMDYMNIPTSVDLIYSSLPEEFLLEQNYPNPFNPATMIRWQSPVSSWQTIKLYNTLGEEVDTIVDEFLEAGYHSKLYNINSTLPSGVYFYQLQAGNFISAAKKMILLR
ncbi:M14 family zinc carboxypeptidase [Ignavibacterium sp.]|uniref:M14 family zinc carboxypeptidase n=1 Tax=Ignavibacterium sp. TaxID=2651167 RepID=UPI00307D0EE9